jgi:endonuclease/exonuclease/phosphatase family metal-dependent hydrolase
MTHTVRRPGSPSVSSPKLPALPLEPAAGPKKVEPRRVVDAPSSDPLAAKELLEGRGRATVTTGEHPQVPTQSLRDLTGLVTRPSGSGGKPRVDVGNSVAPVTNAAVEKHAPLAIHPSVPNGPKDLMVATYNVENLFDAQDNPLTQDFTPQGKENWTEQKVDQKVANLGRVLRAVNGNRGPDIIALTEVENRGVVERLRDKGLKGLGYEEVVVVDGKDARGINNAILSRYPLAEEPTLHDVHDPGSKTWGDKTTRGILEATFKVRGKLLTVFVNHWPSKGGGDKAEAQRVEVGQKLRHLVDETLKKDPDREVLMLGDFNADLGEAPLGKQGLDTHTDVDQARADSRAILDTTATQGAPQMGTHYYHPDKSWSSLDHIMVSNTLLDNKGLTWVPGSTQAVREDFMLAGGTRAPKRFYQPNVDPRAQRMEQTGYSDHLPLVARLRSAD